MASRLSARQWSAFRELAEGEPSTYSRLAAASGLSAVTLRERAAAEGWKKLDFRKSAVLQAFGAAKQVTEAKSDHHNGEDITAVVVTASNGTAGDGDDDPLDRLGRLLSRQAGLILTSAEAQQGILNKGQLDALTSLIKLAEKFETLAQDQATQEQTRSDDEIAAVLERIDDRIVELAQEHAERLVAEKSDA